MNNKSNILAILCLSVSVDHHILLELLNPCLSSSRVFQNHAINQSSDTLNLMCVCWLFFLVSIFLSEALDLISTAANHSNAAIKKMVSVALSSPHGQLAVRREIVSTSCLCSLIIASQANVFILAFSLLWLCFHCLSLCLSFSFGLIDYSLAFFLMKRWILLWFHKASH